MLTNSIKRNTTWELTVAHLAKEFLRLLLNLNAPYGSEPLEQILSQMNPTTHSYPI
jgi:hypothetical protein